MNIDNIILSINEILKYPLFRIQNYDLSLWSIILFFIIIKLSKVLAKKIDKLLIFTYLEKSNFDAGKQDSILKIINYIIYTLGIVIALQTIGIDLSALLAGGAIVAVGIGFGVQTVITNFVAGILILFEQPIKKGDLVKIDGVLGIVKEISIRSTTIKTHDNISIIVPNSKFVTENLENLAHEGTETRLRINVGVSYSSDVRLVEKILIDVAKSEEKVLRSPEPKVQFLEFGDSSLNFVLLAWISDVNDQFFIKSNLNFKVFEEFNKNNIQIPFPQRDIHIKSQELMK